MNTNIDETLNQMDEASKGGFTMKAAATIRKALEQIPITDNMPTRCPAFDALSEITGSWGMAEKVLHAIEAGKLQGVVTFEQIGGNDEIQLGILAEVQQRMAEHKALATAKHAGWNPAEVVTQLMLEIETGTYGATK